MVSDPGTSLAHSPFNACSDADFRDNKPLAQCNEIISRLNTFTCVMVDNLPFLRLSTIRYLLMLGVQFSGNCS